MEGKLNTLECDVVGAALRYVAVADWFEGRPLAHAPNRRSGDDEAAAMDAFNRVGSELRRAGARLLQHLGHRQLVLDRTLAELRT